jgi:hypothetical protein
VVLDSDMAIECVVNAPYEGRIPGSRWLVYGPHEFMPPPEVTLCQVVHRPLISVENFSLLFLRSQYMRLPQEVTD